MKRPYLYPLVPLYAAAVALKNRAFNKKQPYRLQNSVVSIGSISAGGAGKTPLTIALANLLTSNGYKLTVLTRGYGRISRVEVEQVDPTGSARRFGDEPLLLARQTAATVFVAANRALAGRLAEQNLPTPLVHLLDDGFQHRHLHRNLDIVLLTAEDIADTLLPAGNLREPHSALKRAQVIVVAKTSSAPTHPERSRTGLGSEMWVRSHIGNNPKIWHVTRTLTLDSIPQNPLVFSAIARPENFLSMLAERFITPAAHINFPDHHAYLNSDIARLLRRAEAAQATSFLTTAKDFVKLTPAHLAQLQKIGPVQVAHLEVTFADPAAVLADIKSAIAH